MTLDEFWGRLKQVRTLQYEASSGAGTGWNGAGVGDVAISETATNELLFVESGTWQPASGTPLPFSNVYRWTRVEDAVRLEHLRFGADHPVFLFEMIPGENGVWHERSPHLCKDDCYAATLTSSERKLVLAWSVQGPQKRESIRYTYE